MGLFDGNAAVEAFSGTARAVTSVARTPIEAAARAWGVSADSILPEADAFVMARTGFSFARAFSALGLFWCFEGSFQYANQFDDPPPPPAGEEEVIEPSSIEEVVEPVASAEETFTSAKSEVDTLISERVSAKYALVSAPGLAMCRGLIASQVASVVPGFSEDKLDAFVKYDAKVTLPGDGYVDPLSYGFFGLLFGNVALALMNGRLPMVQPEESVFCSAMYLTVMNERGLLNELDGTRKYQLGNTRHAIEEFLASNESRLSESMAANLKKIVEVLDRMGITYRSPSIPPVGFL